MRASISILAVAALLGGCQATYTNTVADIKVVAAKIDKAVSAVFTGAKAAYQWTEAELPQACSLARAASNMAGTAAVFADEFGLSANKRELLIKASAGLNAAGSSAACVAAASGIQPANMTEGATQIIQAFVSVRAAVQGTKVTVTAVAAAGG